MRVIETATLTLEPQVAAHAIEMFPVLSDPAIYEYENQPPTSLEWLCKRYEYLESRQSADGTQQWLNWVIRLPGSELIGYVQATVQDGGRAGIAYELASAYWGRGLARTAVEAMIAELGERYGVRELSAVLKSDNQRSRRLLERLGFVPVDTEPNAIEPDEIMMARSCATPPAASRTPA